MADVDLVFAQAPGVTDLVFGGADTGPVLPVDATLAATLPALSFAARAIPNADFALVATLPALAMSAEGRYQSYAARPTVGQRVTDWQRATQGRTGVQDRSDATGRDKTSGAVAWAIASTHLVGVEHRLPGALVRAEVASRIAHQSAEPISPGDRSSRSSDSLRLRTSSASKYEEALRAEWARGTARHQDTLRDRRRASTSGYAQAQRHAGARKHEGIQSALVSCFSWMVLHQNAIVSRPGPRPVDPGTPPVVVVPCYTPSAALLFTEAVAVDGHLVFVCENHVEPPSEHEPVVVPVRRVYWVTNHVSLRRVLDGTEVPVFSLSLSLDAASWAWGFEAVLPAIALSQVEPHSSGPVELVAVVNGKAFRVLAENISRERSFGAASIRVWGRGRNAALAAPYAPVMNFSNQEPRTARQLMDDVLTHNGTATGVPLGWTVDWGLTDWSVPAGVFNHQGTWIDALLNIAGAAGADLLPHPSALSLKVRHRYPVAPWEWSAVTPDFVLPADAVSRESLRWQDKPAYNRVFVSGQQVGVLGQVTRAGTAGDVLAPMVVDALITEAAAARQRGLAVLADTGRQVEVVLRLPVMAETGIVEPGALVEYRDGGVVRRGLVRSTRVEAGLPEVWQTLGVQTYA